LSSPNSQKRKRNKERKGRPRKRGEKSLEKETEQEKERKEAPRKKGEKRERKKNY
jgi:hypothetical protein